MGSINQFKDHNTVERIKQMKSELEINSKKAQEMDNDQMKQNAQIELLSQQVNQLSVNKDQFGDELRKAKKINLKLKRRKQLLEDESNMYEE